MPALRKGLNSMDHKTMLALLKKGNSQKSVAEWLQVDVSYVKKFAKKTKEK